MNLEWYVHGLNAFIITVAVMLILCGPAFVIGMHLTGMESTRFFQSKRYFQGSWIFVALSLINLLFLEFIDNSLEGFEFEYVLYISLPVAGSALFGGIAFALAKKRRWLPFVPPAAGLVATAVIYAVFLES